MFDGGCEIENGIWRGRSRLQSGQYLIFSDNNVIFAFSVCICVFETLFHIDCMDMWLQVWGCGDPVEVRIAARTIPQSWAFLPNIVFPPNLLIQSLCNSNKNQVRVKVIRITCKNPSNAQLHPTAGPNDVGNTQSAAWEDLRDVWHGWHVNSPCKILLWGPNEFTPGLHNVTT